MKGKNQRLAGTLKTQKLAHVYLDRYVDKNTWTNTRRRRRKITMRTEKQKQNTVLNKNLIWIRVWIFIFFDESSKVTSARLVRQKAPPPSTFDRAIDKRFATRRQYTHTYDHNDKEINFCNNNTHAQRVGCERKPKNNNNWRKKTVETRTRLHNLTLNASLCVFVEMLTNEKKKTTEEFRWSHCFNYIRESVLMQ